MDALGASHYLNFVFTFTYISFVWGHTWSREQQLVGFYSWGIEIHVSRTSTGGDVIYFCVICDKQYLTGWLGIFLNHVDKVQSSVLLQALWHFTCAHTDVPTETMALLYAAFFTRNTNVASTWARWTKFKFRPQVAIMNCGVGDHGQNLVKWLE